VKSIKLLIIYILFVSMAFVSVKAHSAEMVITENESYLLLDNLLNLSETSGDHNGQLEQ